MRSGHRRPVRFVAAGGAVVLLAAAGVWFVADDDGVERQSAEEINELGALPEQLTPLDPEAPNPTGDDPLAIGAPPELEPAATAEELLAQAQQRRDAAGAAADTAPKARPGEPDPGPKPDPDTLLVTFPDGTSDETVSAALAEAGVDGERIAGTDAAVVTTAGQDQAAISASLDAVEAIEAVEPNLVRSTTRNPNDPELPNQQQWLNTIHAPAGWDVANPGSGATVAVLDTGVDLDHPDLAPNLVAGYNALNGTTNAADDNGHGTMVAGIAAAATNNGQGVAGVAWNARIMPVKVLDAEGNGTDADIAEGIIWAVNHGADVINMSLGGPGASTAIDDAVTYALDHDVVLVAAAGNSSSTGVFYPAGAPGVLGVTATDAAGEFAWFSNHGPWYYLAAPGMGIHTTTLAAGPTATYGADSGTSFSSPMVAGAAALLAERHSAWGWYETFDELIRTARDAGPAGLDDAYGFGILDISAALGTTPLGPVAQPSLTGDAGNLQSTPRVIATGTPATETLAYSYDEDWFAFDVPATAGATITVTPPPAQAEGVRASEMDPIVELYGPGGGLVASVDDGFPGDPEQLTVNVAAGRNALRIRSYVGSKSPAPYTVQIDLGEPLPPTAWAPWQTGYSTDSLEESVAIADFNGDGREDLAVATGWMVEPDADFKLFVFTQSASGTLQGPQTLNLTPTPGSASPAMQAGDLDGDGDVDIIRTNNQTIDVAWNTGTQLSEPIAYPTDDWVDYIDVVDLDGTGADEVVAGLARYAPGNQAALHVLRWTGDDMSVEPLGFTAPSPPSTEGIGFGVADLTADGRPDMAVLGDDVVHVRAQQADGTWAPPVDVGMPLPDGLDKQSILTADVDADGQADLVALKSHTLTYRLNQGGTFAPPVTRVVSDNHSTLEADDVTGDGRDDIAIAYYGGRTGVLVQAPSGGLMDEQSLAGPWGNAARSPNSLDMGDLDGDGFGDIATVTDDGGLVLHKHQVPTIPESAGPWVSSTSPRPHATTVAATTRPSITFGRSVAAITVSSDTVFLVDGRNGYVVPSAVSLGGRTTTLTPSTPLQPGVPYQVWVSGVTDPTGTEYAFERFTFTTAAAAPNLPPVNGTYSPFTLDMDGNGYDDILWYGLGNAPDSGWLMGPEGRTVISADIGGTLTPTTGDFDGNGYDDIYWYAPGSGTDVMWWNGRDGFVAETINVNGVYVPLVGDFDRNGYDDIFWYGPGTTADSVWYFRADHARSVVARTVNGRYRPAAGDFTRDGFADILWYGPGTAADSMWRGQPSGFAAGTTVAINGDYRHRTLDVNADGHDEVYLYRSGTGLLLRSSPSGFTGTTAGPVIASTARPIPGDFTGDLRDDLFAYVPGTTTDRLYRGTTTGLA